MYSPIDGGSVLEVQGLKCNIPPIGYVFNIVTKQLEYSGVYSRSEIPSEQYWERIPLPEWYADVLKQESAYDKKKKDDDPPFFDERYEEYKQNEWFYRLNGRWFMNNGSAVYLVGSHYLFMQHTQIDVGYPKFRFPDLEYFYFLQYCIEDPDCYGALELTKRRFGKCFIINTLIRMYDGSVKFVQDVKDGDLVMGNDSHPRLVYGATSGEEEMFEIIPNKGKSFTVNKSHVIYAHITKAKRKYIKGVGKVADGVTVKPIKFTVDQYLTFTPNVQRRLQLERTGWEYQDKDVVIDPYFLGIWLGDGASRNCEISNEDEEVIKYLKEYAASSELDYHNYGTKTKKGIAIRHSISKRNQQPMSYKGIDYRTKTDLMVHLGKHPKTPLSTFGLFKSGEVEKGGYKDNWLWNSMLEMGLKNNKHIPNQFKINSRAKRLLLLAGLLDTDGCLVENKHFKLCFSNKYQQLINDTTELIQSLGFYCGVRKETSSNATVLTIFGDISVIPTKIKRKQATKTVKKYNSLLTGFSVKSVGVDKYYGFAVDDNHLFLLADGTIVHNTYRGGIFLLDAPTRTKMTNAGIQSKSQSDAKKVFAKAVVDPFKKWPRFFKPEYDLSGGVTPKSELRFQNTNVRGKKAEENLERDELGSLIDFGSADPLAYDGQKLLRTFQDEFAKTIECNIYDRWDVLRYCLMDDEGRIIGKALFSSTVEKLDTDKDGVQEGAKKLWDDSDHLRKGDNGRTPSGLYRFFMPADRAKKFDKYGVPNIEQARAEILADRKTIEHNPRALAARMRKEALTVREAFMTDDEDCAFDGANIDNREWELGENPVFKRSGLFKRDILTGKIYFEDIQDMGGDFLWKITQFPPTGHESKSTSEMGLKKPARMEDGAIAIDGYSNSQGGKKYGSRASAWIGRRYDIFNPLNTGKPIGHLYGRPPIKNQLHEQVMLAAEYYGYQAFYEFNSDDYLDYFRQRGMIHYLGLFPLGLIHPDDREKAERHRGVPTTVYSLDRQLDAGISYFKMYCHLIDFENLLTDAKQFDPNNRTEFDITVSFLILLVVLAEPVPVPKKPPAPLIRVFSHN